MTFAIPERVTCPFNHNRPCQSECPSMAERACINGQDDEQDTDNEPIDPEGFQC